MGGLLKFGMVAGVLCLLGGCAEPGLLDSYSSYNIHGGHYVPSVYPRPVPHAWVNPGRGHGGHYVPAGGAVPHAWVNPGANHGGHAVPAQPSNHGGHFAPAQSSNHGGHCAPSSPLPRATVISGGGSHGGYFVP